MRNARIRAGMTQVDLAEQLELSHSHINKIETGQRPYPHVRITSAIAAALGLDLDDLIADGELDESQEAL